MDRKAIAVIGASAVFIIIWVFVISPKYLIGKPAPPTTNTVATLVSGTNSAEVSPASATPAMTTAGTAVTAALPVLGSNAMEQTITLTNREARYIFTSHGGGLRRVELVGFPESAKPGQATVSNRVASLNAKAPSPLLALLGEASLQGDGIFTLTQTASGVRAEKVLGNGLVVIKEFQPTSNYLFNATARIENRSAQPVAVPAHQIVVGTAAPMGPLPTSTDIPGVMWCDNAGKPTDIAQPWFDNKTLGCIPGTPRTEYRGGVGTAKWISSHNQFFAMVAMPPTNHAAEVVMHSVKLPMPTAGELPPNATPPREAPSAIQAEMLYPATNIAAGGSLEHSFTYYAGPKKYTILAEISGERSNNMDQVMGFGFWGIVSKVLLTGMNWLHDTLKLSYALTIIAITILIKLLFWPLTAASTRSAKRMAALAPQMKALQEKYKDNPAKLQEKTMAFWKEHKVNPVGGCLPMLIQIPVFFGFFTMIRSAVELRGASFLWCADLSQPDTILYLGGFPVNPLPLIMGATMLWQARLTPPSPGMDPAQAKMMKYMPLIFMMFLYFYSAALTLYWTTNNLMTILQTKLTKMKEPGTTEPAGSAPANKDK
ncbi:MAG: hypothetical protein RLY20_3135 [Verrucomicrobiota bacterium]|jgi:YidC/Oxa1 family membrane protein insertase